MRHQTLHLRNNIFRLSQLLSRIPATSRGKCCDAGNPHYTHLSYPLPSVSTSNLHPTTINRMASETFAADLVQYLNESCSAFHAVEAAKTRLLAANFTQVSESERWNLAKGGKYFFTRNTTTIVAFTVGGAFESGNGFTVAGAHTDSPCLRIKPVTCTTKGDALVLNTQPYGGGLWHTWFDRDLGLAGRAIVRREDGSLANVLVRIDAPIARIPNLAIHLTSGSERESFAPNLHEHAKAILTMDPKSTSFKFEESAGVDAGSAARLNPFLLQLVSSHLGISPASIVDLELQLIDIQPSTIGGASNEFLISGRLDNLCSSYQILRAIIDSADADLATSENIRMALLFDHEEVGSSSCTGAGSSLFMDTLRTINEIIADGSHVTLMRSLRKSFVVSADMAHGVHPNYAHKHDPTMAPKINGGLVIKHNANQRYATNPVSASIFREIGRLAGVPMQEFAVRADAGCGSTIGPIIATLSGILTVDVGTPQFSMHSIREMMGAHDAFNGYAHIKGVYNHHNAVASRFDTA